MDQQNPLESPRYQTKRVIKMDTTSAGNRESVVRDLPRYLWLDFRGNLDGKMGTQKRALESVRVMHLSYHSFSTVHAKRTPHINRYDHIR
jgi:hypothetical protein